MEEEGRESSAPQGQNLCPEDALLVPTSSSYNPPAYCYCPADPHQWIHVLVKALITHHFTSELSCLFSHVSSRGTLRV